VNHPTAAITNDPGSGPAPAAAEAEIYIGRQPIVDKERSLVAFELLFRTADGSPETENSAMAAAGVIVNAFTEFSVQDTLGPHRGFINVDRELLMSDLLAALPPQRIALELTGAIEPDDAVITRCKQLRAAGYRLALDQVTAFDTRVKKLLPYANMVKLDTMNMDDALLARFVSALGRLPLLLIADKVETPERAEHCMKLGFHLFQGYHFARPQILEGRRAPPAKLALLRLTNLLTGDADAGEIESELKQHPDLAYNLMRIANSAAFGLTRKIDSLAQCIAVLGRSKMSQWVQLLLYAPERKGAVAAANPLMHLAATRGKWMENLALAVSPGDRQFHDLAFMVGILSLLGALLGMPLTDVIVGLNLADEAKAALLEHKGPLGTLLRLIEYKERNEFQTVSRTLHTIAYLTPAKFTAAELSAAAWAQAVAAA
jgi:EAL and modified HD-GYP domain-containing signal transduction protein